MPELEILYHGEIQIIDFGESRTLGPWIKIKLSRENGDPLEAIRGLDMNGSKTQHIANATLTLGDILGADQPDNGDKPYGQLASLLFKNGFFYAPGVAEAIGSDESYRKWIQCQPSAYSGEFSEYIDGIGKCEASHVRRAAQTGLNHKPPYWCIPLTHDEHINRQHAKGESDLAPREWFEKMREKYFILWAKFTLANHFNEDSLGRVKPQDLEQWCVKHNIAQYLPKEYRES